MAQQFPATDYARDESIDGVRAALESTFSGAAAGGDSFTTGAHDDVIGPSGRAKVYIVNQGDPETSNAVVWLGFDSAAQAGKGIALYPGQAFDEYVGGSISFLVQNGPVVVTWQEFS